MFVVQPLEIIAHKIVRRRCYTRWPYLIEAKICGVADGTCSYYDDLQGNKKNIKLVRHDMTPEDARLWKKTAVDISKKYVVMDAQSDICVFIWGWGGCTLIAIIQNPFSMKFAIVIIIAFAVCLCAVGLRKLVWSE